MIAFSKANALPLNKVYCKGKLSFTVDLLDLPSLETFIFFIIIASCCLFLKH